MRLELLRRLRQEDFRKFQATLGQKVKFYLKQKENAFVYVALENTTPLSCLLFKFFKVYMK